MTSVRFPARIHRIGINPCVDVPREVSEAFGKRGYVPVSGSLNGTLFRATLVPSGAMRHRLFINGDLRARAGVGEGDMVEIALEDDAAPRAMALPDALAGALENDPIAAAAFERLTPSRKKEILAYLNALKRQDSLERDVGRVIASLKGTNAGKSHEKRR